MNNSIIYSSDYSNRKHDSFGLMDRIINIKFTRKSGKTFTLRSDYEPVWVGDSLYFRTCSPKPDIRVQYTQYQATMINVDIYITNLNIMENVQNQNAMDQAMINAGIDAVTSTARFGQMTNQPNDTLTRLGDTVVRAEIEMGYRGQFFNWANYKRINSAAVDYEAFMNLEIPGVNVDEQRIFETQTFFRNEIRKCSVVIEWAANISNPPDRITQFHGYVGATEVGLQPFALLSLDCAGVAGAAGLITKSDIAKGLDDEYYTIEEVPISYTGSRKNRRLVVDDNKGGTPHDLILHNRSTAYRNFFNGGKPFTLLEGYCFHMVTRRFIRSDVSLQRNDLLEKAALDFALALNYPPKVPGLRDPREATAQKVYQKEKPFYPNYFTEENNKLNLSDSAPTSFVTSLETAIDNIMIEFYIGARYTVKNLPEYRKLYNVIRYNMTLAARKGEYMTWWEAAENLRSMENKDKLLQNPAISLAMGRQQEPSMTQEEVEIKNNLIDVKEYTLSLERGKMAYKDCYLDTTLSREWILPVQNLSTSVPLKNAAGKKIYICPPASITDTGDFTGEGEYIPAKCFSGLFEVRDAYMFGVPVLCSEEASRQFEKKNKKAESLTIQFMQDPQAQVEWICQTYGFNYYKLHNGGFYIYASSETSRDTTGQDFVKNQSQKPFRIPAIYDMTLTPIRKIRMPFVSFLNPMTLVEWNSSTMIGTLMSFYYQPDKGRNFFMVIKNSIDFATVSDYNTMEIDLVDAQYADKSEVPAAVLTQNDKKTYIETIIIPDDQMNTWRKIYESPVGLVPIGLRDNWPVTESVDQNLSDGNSRVSSHQFFMSLLEWNPHLFFQAEQGVTGWAWDDYSFRVDKTANKLYGNSRPERQNFPDINYCLPLLTDPTEHRIYLKFPFMPSTEDYANMKEHNKDYVLVYQSGYWEMKLKESIKKDFKIGEV